MATSSKIVFQLRPRINTAGRIADASMAAELLASTDATHAQRLVDAIEELNLQRRELDRETRDEALLIAERLMEDDPVALVVLQGD